MTPTLRRIAQLSVLAAGLVAASVTMAQCASLVSGAASLAAE